MRGKVRQPKSLVKTTIDRAADDGALTLSRPQRGLWPTLAFWNQPDRAMRPIRIAWLIGVILSAVASSFLSQPLGAIVAIVSTVAFFLGLGAYERVLRRELERRRGQRHGALDDADRPELPAPPQNPGADVGHTRRAGR